MTASGWIFGLSVPHRKLKNGGTMKQGKQRSTEELEEKAKNVETFNPYWHDGEFLGPNTFRQENDTEKYGKEES